MEPRWVTKTLRLFPRPVFAIGVAIACILVTIIFLLGAVLDGNWACGLVAFAFGDGAYLILAALFIRRRRQRFARRGESELSPPNQLPKGSSRPLGTAKEASKRGLSSQTPDIEDLRGLPPVSTPHLLIYFATVLVWEAHVAILLLRTFGVFQVPGTWRIVLAGISLAITLFTFQVGRSDIVRLKRSGGKVELTGIQVTIVCGIVVSIAITVVIVHAVITGNR